MRTLPLQCKDNKKDQSVGIQACFCGNHRLKRIVLVPQNPMLSLHIHDDLRNEYVGLLEAVLFCHQTLISILQCISHTINKTLCFQSGFIHRLNINWIVFKQIIVIFLF